MMDRWRRTRSTARTLEEYYQRTARGYNREHEHELQLYYVALRHMLTYIDWIGAKTVLDTGCGTGTVRRLLRQARPELRVYGNDSSADLLRLAARDPAGDAGTLVRASSERLPFADGAFDVAIETEVLHHVPYPDRVIAEMLRVATRAVFLWDTNMYSHGGMAARLARLGLARTGLLRPVNRLRRDGHDWFYSEGDGVAYSYSVFDAYPRLSAACAEVTAIATDGEAGAGVWPFLRGHHILLCGFREPLPVTWEYSR